jgi:hypothetical protein
MKTNRCQRIMFIILVVCAFLNPILDVLPWFRYTILPGALFYLALRCYFPLRRDDNNCLTNALAGLVYSKLLPDNFPEAGGAPTDP